MTRILLSSSRIFFIACCIFFSHDAGAQIKWGTKYGFCGLAVKKSGYDQMKRQVAFLHLQANDTLVDIGAQSGWFAAVITKLSPVQPLHFILVDIDSSCLNERKLAAMKNYYSTQGIDLSKHSFQLVHNKPVSIPLPGSAFQHIMVRNTLHEVHDPVLFLRQVAWILRNDGELVIIEEEPTGKKKIHKGCRKPLLTFAEINTLMEEAGLRLKEKQQDRHRKTRIQLLRYVK